MADERRRLIISVIQNYAVCQLRLGCRAFGKRRRGIIMIPPATEESNKEIGYAAQNDELPYTSILILQFHHAKGM